MKAIMSPKKRYSVDAEHYIRFRTESCVFKFGRGLTKQKHASSRPELFCSLAVKFKKLKWKETETNKV